MQIFKAATLISVSTIISQLLGVVRDKMLISIVGIGITLDIYNAAFKIPDFISALMVSFVGVTVIVPYLQESLVKRDNRELLSRMSSLFYTYTILMLLVLVFVYITRDFYLHYLFPGFDNNAIYQLSDTLKIMLLQPILLGVSNLFICYAQSKKVFIAYAISPIIYNLSIIASIYYLYTPYHLNGLAIGVVMGALLHMLVNFIIVYKDNLFPRFKLYDFNFIKTVSSKVFLRSIGFGIFSTKQYLIVLNATLFGPGYVSVYTFGLNLLNMAVQFFSTSYSIAAFPALSAMHESGNKKELKQTILKTTKNIFLYSSLLALIIYFLSEIIVAIIYNGNKEILMVFQVLLLCVPFASIEQYLARAVYAIREFKFGTILQVYAVTTLSISLFAGYYFDLGYLYIAYAYNIAMIIEIIIAYRFIKKI